MMPDVRKTFHYTGTGDPAAEEQLSRAVPGIGADIAASRLKGLAGVYLGGGYGRGEGGVFRCADGQARLYNDLDFFVVADGCGFPARKRIDKALRAVSEKWSARLGIEVDFGPVKKRSELKKVAHTLMFQELRHGYITVCGDAGLLETELPDLNPETLPVLEALRLMLNRGMGLLLAREALAEQTPETGFILRNLNKCVLGCGDALLISCGKYAWSVHDREWILSGQRDLPESLERLYPEAVRFKLEPSADLPENPVDCWNRLRLLWRAVLCRILGVENGIPDIRPALHELCRRERACSWKNVLRIWAKTRRLEISAEIADDPRVQVLAELYDALNCAAPVLSCRLRRAWQVFN